MRRHLKVAAVATILLFGGTAQGALITEDFQDGGNPAVPGFDPVFKHLIGLDEFARNSGINYAFSSNRFTSPDHSLFFGSGTDYVTFNLNPAEYVDYAEVWMVSFQDNPAAYFHVIGTNGSLLQQTTGSVLSGGTFMRFDTSSASLGRIVEIRLTGFEGFFDDLRINVVPEPSTLFFLVTGFAFLARRRRLTTATLALVPVIFFVLTPGLSAEVYYGPGESPSIIAMHQAPPPLPLSPPGTEVVDIVFVLDGSGSISDGAWELEKAGIANTISGQFAFVPANGSVAISVVRFEDFDPGIVEIPLTTIDSPATANALATQIIGLNRAYGGTELVPGLEAAVDVLLTGSGLERLIVVATDAGLDQAEALNTAEQIRTGTGYAAGLGQTRICSVYINPCSAPPGEHPARFPAQAGQHGGLERAGWCNAQLSTSQPADGLLLLRLHGHDSHAPPSHRRLRHALR